MYYPSMSRITRYGILLLLVVIEKTDAHENDLHGTSTNGNISPISSLNTTFTHFVLPFRKNEYIDCTLLGSPESNISLIFTQGIVGDIAKPSVANFAEGFAERKNILVFQGRSDLRTRTEMFKIVADYYHFNVIGGRSMGSRAAIMAARELVNVKTLILHSFPLASDENESRAHLLLGIDEGIDVLLIIGDRDRKTDLNKLRPLLKQIKAKAWLIVVKNADHGMKMIPSEATDPVGKEIGKVVAEWMDKHDASLTNCEVHWDDERNEVIVGPWF